MCDNAVIIDPKCLEYVRDKFKTKEMCLEAVKMFPWLFILIPEYLTDDYV